ncbi:hypothetical protein QTH89_17775 [Variovorax sp. J22G21]|uniref:hypothetical protein n=1 Tax=Variovorax fucosicus TaxID=3053517 RepID=UPI002576AB71|nr:MULTISPECIES: hypothetical protein [unclassified Variovorax]MDM0038283.1 hypothetical protein [Variovorax sp. J22R193]MDM0063059.1 hypothetical protein [Variovorax sp. J22G21]
MSLLHFIAGAALLGAFSLPAAAQPTYDGYLCCNVRSDGSWISDSNYAESGKRVIPVGTPTRVTGYGRSRVQVEINGAKQAIGNDYSRDLDLGTFAKRWVVTEDPSAKIAKFPPKIRDAIKSARIAKGMTREQVAMAVGYPISSENPNLDAPTWRMWLGSFSEFQVQFDRSGRVSEVTTDPQTRNLVVMD